MKTIFRYFYGIFTGGLLTYQFYFWFLFPVFAGLPNITYWQAVGLSSFLYLFNQTKAIELAKFKKYEDTDIVVYGSLIIPWVVLGLGLITHLIIR